MKPIEVLTNLINSLLLSDRWRNKGPGKVIESLSAEKREALSQLKSDDIDSTLRVEDYHMWGDAYEKQLKDLEFEKNLGIEPPPRKKYEE